MTYHSTARDPLEATFAALADPTRRRVFEALREGARSVADLAAEQPVSRPAVSQHLKVLEKAGLVTAKVRGTRRIYGLRREGLAEMRCYLDGFWSDILSAYAAEAERQAIDEGGGDDDRGDTKAD